MAERVLDLFPHARLILAGMVVNRDVIAIETGREQIILHSFGSIPVLVKSNEVFHGGNSLPPSLLLNVARTREAGRLGVQRKCLPCSSIYFDGKINRRPAALFYCLGSAAAQQCQRYSYGRFAGGLTHHRAVAGPFSRSTRCLRTSRSRRQTS